MCIWTSFFPCYYRFNCNEMLKTMNNFHYITLTEMYRSLWSWFDKKKERFRRCLHCHKISNKMKKLVISVLVEISIYVIYLFQSNGPDQFGINNKNLFQEDSQPANSDVPPALPPKTGTPTRPPPPPPGPFIWRFKVLQILVVTYRINAESYLCLIR